ncbi:MAG: hypothetical protein ABIN97_02075 [Ginsengibacter sp.]
MKAKVALTGVGLVLLIIALIVYYLYNKPHTGISNIDTDVNITSTDFYKDFQQDETLANKKYLNKVIEVTGKVSDVQNTNGSQIIFLGSGDDMGGISCKLSNDESNKKPMPKVSATITIKGKCSGYTMDVNLVDCIIKL